MDLITKLVKNVIETRYEDLPPLAIEVAKKSVLDTLGCLILGSSTSEGKGIVGFVLDYGGKKESTIMIYGGKVPAFHAVIANCTMARAMDFDDVFEGGKGKGVAGHIGATFMPVTFAFSEYVERKVSGKDFILANVLGSDIACRLRMSATKYHGWQGETYAPFGVVATGGSLLGFDEEMMTNAMGIAYTQCAGSAQGYEEGASTVPVQQGFGARSGVMAVILAQRGFTGSKNVLQGTYGFFPVYDRDEYDADMVISELGKRFESAYVSIKPYPSGKGTHIPIDATMKIMKENKISPDDIEEVIVNTSAFVYNACGKGDNKYKPQNVRDAHFSVPYAVANAAIRGGLELTDLTEEAIKDKDILNLARRVKVIIDPDLDKIATIPPNKVEIKTKSGLGYETYVEYVSGHPKKPMDMEQCIDKFKKSLKYSARAIPEGNVNKLMQLVDNLEELDDVREIINAVTDF
ncbi:MAG: MmgE/PrpD family protein [Thermodesulfobacteriota bacterium]|nr:MmgE/PrpD family protein [Thermodesulfobacteriota bacterium]